MSISSQRSEVRTRNDSVLLHLLLLLLQSVQGLDPIRRSGIHQRRLSHLILADYISELVPLFQRVDMSVSV